MPWDLRISREHCDIHLAENRLYVRCLEVALNPAYRLGEPIKEFSIGPGEAFRIGQTTFRVDLIEQGAEPKIPGASDSWEFDGPEEHQRPLEEDIESLKARVDSLRRKVDAGQDVGDVTRSATDAAAEAKRQEVKALRAQVEVLKSELNAAQQPAVDCNQPADDEITDLKELIGELRGEIESRGAAKRKLAAEERKDSARRRRDEETGMIHDSDEETEAAQGEADPEEKPKKGLEALRARLAEAAKKKKPKAAPDEAGKGSWTS